MRKFLPFALLAFALLPACNFGGNYRPPGEGYANATTSVTNGGYFARQTAKRIVLVNGVRSFKNQNVRVTIAPDYQSATVFVNNASYNLTVDPLDPNRFYGTNSYGLIGFNTSSDVQIVYFDYDDNAAINAGYENNGNFVVGFTTDPVEVRDRVGTASYSGAATAKYYVGNFDETASGTAQMTANFGTGSVYGTIALTDDQPGSGLAMPDIDMSFNQSMASNVSGNGFSGGISTTVNTTGGDTATISGGALNGQFYGVDAASIGGTFWNTGTFNGQQMLLQGAFASN